VAEILQLIVANGSQGMWSTIVASGSERGKVTEIIRVEIVTILGQFGDTFFYFTGVICYPRRQ